MKKNKVDFVEEVKDKCDEVINTFKSETFNNVLKSIAEKVGVAVDTITKVLVVQAIIEGVYALMVVLIGLFLIVGSPFILMSILSPIMQLNIIAYWIAIGVYCAIIIPLGATLVSNNTKKCIGAIFNPMFYIFDTIIWRFKDK